MTMKHDREHSQGNRIYSAPTQFTAGRGGTADSFQVNDAVADGEHGRGGAILHAQFGKQAFQV